MQHLEGTPQPYIPGLLRHLIDLDSGDLLDLSASPKGIGPGPDGMGAWKAIFAGTGQSAADLDHDGYPDTAKANWSNQNVDLYRGQPDGSLQSWKQFAVGKRPVDVALVDLNGDGWEDIAVANSESQNLSVLLATGQGKFSASVSVPIAAHPCTVESRVLDRDEHRDLLCLSKAGTLHLLHGDGTGLGFVEEVLWIGGAPADLVSGDVDGDGWLELLVTHPTLGRFDLFELDPATGLHLKLTQYLGEPIASANFGDYEGDGIADLFVVSHLQAKRLRIFSGDGAEGFSLAATIEGIYVHEATSADLDRDGYQELLVADADVTVLERLPDGSYGMPLNWPAPKDVEGFRLADFDGDSRDELLLVKGIPHSSVLGWLNWEMQVSRWPFFEQPILKFALPLSAQEETWDVGDFDGDGRADAVCLQYAIVPGGGYTKQLVESRNAGSTFGAWTPVYSSPYHNRLLVSDFDQDGFADVALHQTPGDDGTGVSLLSICFGSPQGLVGGKQIELDLGGAVFGVVSGDVNGDSLPDLVVSTSAGPGVNYQALAIFSGVTGPARFAAQESLCCRFLQQVLIGDFDGDGYDDLLGQEPLVYGEINPWGGLSPLDWTLVVHRGGPAGVEELATRIDIPIGPFPVPFNSQPLRVVDLNGDAHLDLLAYGDGFRIYFGDGKFGFPIASEFGAKAVWSGNDTFEVGDPNGDGQPDLLHLEYWNQRFALLEHRP